MSQILSIQVYNIAVWSISPRYANLSVFLKRDDQGSTYFDGLNFSGHFLSEKTLNQGSEYSFKSLDNSHVFHLSCVLRQTSLASLKTSVGADHKRPQCQ